MAVIDGIRATIRGDELRDLLLQKASDYKRQGILFRNELIMTGVQIDAGGAMNSIKQDNIAALFSFLADHIEDSGEYRIPLDQITTLGLHEERIR